MKFRFVDKIIRYKEADYIEGLKVVSLEEYFLLNKLGCRNYFPQTLMAECLFQLANFLIFKTFKSKLAILTMFERIEFKRALGPGDIMRMRVQLDSTIEENIMLSGVGHVDGEEVIVGSGCLGVLINIEKLYDPDHYNQIFNNLYQIVQQ